ncbi:MAG: tRNA (adenosine(37)-N6)-dimethylallyltransferase MiaA [Verrucomicrobiota bacterium]
MSGSTAPSDGGSSPNPLPLILAGPTAVGKSAVALELAHQLNGEILSVDSMQVYRGLDIGTAKPTPAERSRIPHHGVDVVGLDDTFDAARFVALAGEIIPAIQSRGRVPILCGGTGLYFNAWMNGLGDAPAPDPDLRSRLEALPTPVLLEELARTDPVTFDDIDPDNWRRLVRAVEVIRITGRPFSSQRARWPERAPMLAGRSFGLWRNRPDAVARIDSRVDAMFRNGLMDETRSLLALGLARNRTASQAIGYRQVLEHLEGLRGPLETREQVKIKTRQFAKRQMTWFRGQMDLEWLEIATNEEPTKTAERILAAIGSGHRR